MRHGRSLKQVHTALLSGHSWVRKNQAVRRPIVSNVEAVTGPNWPRPRTRPPLCRDMLSLASELGLAIFSTCR